MFTHNQNVNEQLSKQTGLQYFQRKEYGIRNLSKDFPLLQKDLPLLQKDLPLFNLSLSIFNNYEYKKTSNFRLNYSVFYFFPLLQPQLLPPQAPTFTTTVTTTANPRSTYMQHCHWSGCYISIYFTNNIFKSSPIIID